MITLNGNLQDYCKGCPYMELIELANTMCGKIYGCENSRLCSQLWKHLQNNVTAGGDPK